MRLVLLPCGMSHHALGNPAVQRTDGPSAAARGDTQLLLLLLLSRILYQRAGLLLLLLLPDEDCSGRRGIRRVAIRW